MYIYREREREFWCGATQVVDKHIFIARMKLIGRCQGGLSASAELHRTSWAVPTSLAQGGVSRLKKRQQLTVPSGKHTKNYGKSPCSMGKSTINHHFQ